MVFCGIDHREDVDAQPLEDELELVDQGDVARAEDVFGELGGRGRGDGHDLRDEAAVEGRSERHGVRLVGTEAAGPEVWDHRVQRAGDEGEIGLAVRAQGRGHADQDSVDRGDRGEVGGGDEAAGLDHGPAPGMADMLERAPAGIEAVDLGPVDIEPGDPEPRHGRRQHQGQPHMTHADDAEPFFAPGQAIREVVMVHDRSARRLSRWTRV